MEASEARRARRIWPVKGVAGFGRPIWPRHATTGGRNRGELFLIGADTAKERVYSRLRVDRPGPGYCHFPLDRDRDWFEQLTGERVIVERGEHKFTKPAGVRNEALDARLCQGGAVQPLHQRPEARRARPPLHRAGPRHHDRIGPCLSGVPLFLPCEVMRVAERPYTVAHIPAPVARAEDELVAVYSPAGHLLGFWSAREVERTGNFRTYP